MQPLNYTAKFRVLNEFLKIPTIPVNSGLCNLYMPESLWLTPFRHLQKCIINDKYLNLVNNMRYISQKIVRLLSIFYLSKCEKPHAKKMDSLFISWYFHEIGILCKTQYFDGYILWWILRLLQFVAGLIPIFGRNRSAWQAFSPGFSLWLQR